ncbi:hypothetical protein SEA_WOFFORD_46 [Streptomyces phage Wofford]|uniref:Uncharacterized protein n=1 Tax=Streptomyces phage Wofford TaxID=2283267 RepID=A0A345M9S1_9CAUD|nr:hypothetical protein HWB78_gp228 [Streptomyces phage Wollford]AXH67242.1 hypothetical protein SEA_WOFFORD_46 [Streptomyces phage Wollford]
MSYQLQVLADAPFSYWKLDGNGPVYEDSAGSFRQADLTATAIPHPALVTGSGNALVLQNSNRLQMDDPVFNKGYEARQWSLEAWIKPLSINGEISIMSHSGNYDGLTITPTTINFRTKYLTAPASEINYIYNSTKAFHVVGVHTNGKNSLYVDGNLVAEIDITDEQEIDAYNFLTSDLIAGESVSTSKIAIDSPAVYAFALPADTIKKHYDCGVDVESSDAIAGFNDASHWNFSDESRNIAVTKLWDTEEEWPDGVIDNVVIANDFIVPSYEQTETEEVVDGLIVPIYTNTSIPGTWIGSVPLGMTLAGISDAIIRYRGEGSFTIECSTDNGTTWQDVDNAPSFDLDETDSIGIKVSFTGGIVDDQSYVDYVQVIGYEDKNINGTRSDRAAVLNGTGISSIKTYQPIEYADDNGLLILSGDISVGIDSSYDGEEEPGDLDINGIDMWVKPVAGNIISAGANSISRVGNTITFSGYSDVTVNGVSVASGATVFVNDSWYHIGGVFSTPGNYPITIGTANARIGPASAIYGDISLAGLQQIYASYLGLPGLTVDDESVIGITTPADEALLYAHVWGITPAG